MKFIIFILFLSTVIFSGVSAQNQKDPDELHESPDHNGENNVPQGGHFRVAILLGHTIIPLDENGTRTTIPSWGLDIEYWISHKFGFGLHNDLEIISYVIKRGENEEDLIREYPKVFTLDMLYKPIKDFVVFGGIGKEFEVNENYTLFRFGLEYEIPLKEKWDICPTFFYDSRIDAFNTYSIMLGIGRIF